MSCTQITAVITTVEIHAVIEAAIVIQESNTMIGNKFLAVQTDSDGVSFAAFESYACKNLVIVNSTDFSIDVQRGGSGAYVTIPALQDFNFGGLTNANQIAVKRSDSDTDQITIRAEAYS